MYNLVAKMVSQKIERFYKDIQGLNLKSPVSAIAEATGENKGNVSKYLNQKMQPSDSFLNRFYLKFGKVVQHPTTTTETPQNGQKSGPHPTLTEIGELVKKIQYVTNLTIEQIADKIDFSRPHLTTLTKSGESKKALARLKETFAAELAAAPELTTMTNKPVFDVKSKDTPDKDTTIKNLSEVTKSQQDLLAEMSGKLITLVSKVIDKL